MTKGIIMSVVESISQIHIHIKQTMKNVGEMDDFI